MPTKSIEIAELGLRLRPKAGDARIGLAIARLLDHRPAEVRQLLAGFRAARADTHALATQLFVVAEIYLGHRERADAILATLSDGSDQPASAVVAALRATDALPPLVQDQPGHSGGSQSSRSFPGTSEANPPASAASAASDSGSVCAGPVIATSSPDGSTPLLP